MEAQNLPSELDALLADCSAEKSETTMTIRGNLEEWEKHSNFQYERSKAQNALLKKLVECQKEDDKSRWIMRSMAWFFTKAGAAVAIGIFAALTYVTTETVKALLAPSKEDAARRELIDRMLSEKFGSSAAPDSQ